MRASRFLFGSGIVLGLILMGRNMFSRKTITLTEIIRRIDVRSLAAKKSAQLALEKSTCKPLRKIAQQLIDDVMRENKISKNMPDNDFYSWSEIFEAEEFKFNYDHNEKSSFDLSFISHQLDACNEIVALLKQAVIPSDARTKHFALKNLSIFSHYQENLKNFYKVQFTKNDHYIRELAYKIWDAEGRPEGEANRHWLMAVELLKKTSSGDFRLVIDKNIPLIGSLFTLPNIPAKNFY